MCFPLTACNHITSHITAHTVDVTWSYKDAVKWTEFIAFPVIELKHFSPDNPCFSLHH